MDDEVLAGVAGGQGRLVRLLATTTQTSRTRCCFLLFVKKDRLSDYVEAHQHVWPEMRQALHESAWRNYSLFLDARTGMVVGYFEAEDVEAAQQAMARTETNTTWQAAMRQYFVQPAGGTNHPLSQYFYVP